MSKICGVRMRGSVILALKRLHELQHIGESKFSPQVSVENTAGEILEVAIIERFEAAFGITISEYMDMVKAERKPTCADSLLPLKAHSAAAGQ